MTPRRAVGVDGCRAGWIAVTRVGAALGYAIFPTLRAVLDAHPGGGPVFVDIPIGLPSAGTPIRPCDRLARQILGPGRRASVFPVPCREAVHAPSAAVARRVNVRTLGRSVNAQTWNICGKIAEVDRLLRADSRARRRVREAHPELCFWGLNGGRAMRWAKGTPAGQRERLAVLARHEPGARRLLRAVLASTRRSDVQADDVLDALVLFVAAAAPAARLARLAGQPARDERGLPIEMLYLAPR